MFFFPLFSGSRLVERHQTQIDFQHRDFCLLLISAAGFLHLERVHPVVAAGQRRRKRTDERTAKDG